MQVLEPLPEIGEFQGWLGTVKIRRASAGLPFDAFENLPRGGLAIGGYAAESEVPLGVVDEVCESVGRQFPKSFTNVLTWSRSHCTSL